MATHKPNEPYLHADPVGQPVHEPVAAPSTVHRRNRGWTWRIGVIGLVGALLAIVVGLAAVTLARYDIVDKLAGFGTFMQMLPVVGAAGLIGAIALAIGFAGKAGPKWPGALAVVLALGFAGVIYTQVIAPARAAPPLHDVTTDVNDPPPFATLTLREDNLVPFASQEEWRAAHRAGYPDLAPVVIQSSPTEVLGTARVLAEERGWEIASVDTNTGRMEATAFAGYIRFRDDVVVEVTPIADGSTRVDMRSVSRVGVSDLGYNAARVREFLAALRARG